jgi:hypothetical protein
MILYIILYDTLQREMGLNIEKDDGFVSFGIKAKKVELFVPPILQYFCTYLIFLIKPNLIVCKHSW